MHKSACACIHIHIVFPHSDNTHGHVVKTRRCGDDNVWKVMVVWYTYKDDESAEPMSEGDDEMTSTQTYKTVYEIQNVTVCVIYCAIIIIFLKITYISVVYLCYYCLYIL